MKKLISIFLLSIMFLCSGYRKPYKYTIDAGKDAFLHNNIGLNYLRDRIYYAAIEEFKIAINLSPNTQATAIFKYNLGKTYTYIGYPELAQPCLEDAVQHYWQNLQYYIDLADCYSYLKITDKKIEELSKSELVSDKILLGVLYIKSGNVHRGIFILDDICANEPDLLITPTLMQYIKDSVKADDL